MNFGSAVDGTSNGLQILTVENSSGTFTYDGAIGGTTRLSHLSITTGNLVKGKTGGTLAANSVALNVNQGSIGSGSLSSSLTDLETQYNIDLRKILPPSSGFIQVATSTLTLALGSTKQAANVFIDVSPAAANDAVTVNKFSASGDVVLTSMGLDQPGTLNINNISAGGHVLIYTQGNGSNVALGTIHSDLTVINSIAVDAGGTLSMLTNENNPYNISTGGTPAAPLTILLQLLPDLTIPRSGIPLDAASQLSEIYADYKFFQIQKTFPSPTESIIRPLQVNSFTATVGVSGEKGWHFTINWGDGSNPDDSPVTLAPLISSSPATYSFSHDFTTLTASAKYEISFTIYIDQSISLATHSGSNQTFYEQRSLSATALASAVPPPASLFAPQKQVPLATAPAIAVAPIGFTQPFVKAPDEIQLGTTDVQNLAKKKFLTMSLIPEDGSSPVKLSMTAEGILKIVEGSKDENSQLQLDLLNGDQLIEQFKGLPDGRYRLNLHRNLGDDSLDERTVLEAVIINGAPLNPVEEIIERLRRNLDREKESDTDVKAGNGGASLETAPNETRSLSASQRETKSLIRAVSKTVATLSETQN